MPVKDIREWLKLLEDEGQLARIKTLVDWKYELAAVTRRGWDTMGQTAPAFLFENIKDYQSPSPNKAFTGSLQSYSRIAMAMDMPKTGDYPTDIIAEYRRRLKNPLKPILVDKKDAPCKQNIDLKDKADLTKFPVPYWHERDGNRYFGTMTGVISKDPDTGWINCGNYRQMLIDEQSMTILMEPGRAHVGYHYNKYIERGEKFPVAIAVGMHPIENLLSASPLGVGDCEFDYAGGLIGRPVEMVECETVPLTVPANAEIIVEGWVDPKDQHVEGPFGEFTGFYGGMPGPKPVIRVSAITYRDDPIFEGTVEGYPVNASHIMSSVAITAFVLDTMDRAGVPSVRNAACIPTGGFAMNVNVSVKPTSVGHAQRVAFALFSTPISWTCFKYVTVVDEDIDPWNAELVDWAITFRCSPGRDVYIYPKTYGLSIDPSVEPEKRGFMDRMLIDATRPYDWPPNPIWGTEGVNKGIPLKYPPLNRPAPEIMEHVNSRWEEYGIKPVKDYVGNPRGPFDYWWTSECIEDVKTGKISR